jgi:hypothetical protein
MISSNQPVRQAEDDQSAKKKLAARAEKIIFFEPK